ncbi:MAG TPA: phosphomethylpyrimidine synthase ThiC [bacterium]
MSARGRSGTILERLRRGETPPAVLNVARQEGVDPEVVRAGVAAGTIVLCRPGKARGARHLGVGAGLSVKVNANLGTSQARSGLKGELAKLAVAVAAGADAVMDLSTGGDLDLIRAAIIAASPVSVGTVPIYQAAVDTLAHHPGRLDRMDPDALFDEIDRHGRDGVGFVTVHCGLTLQSLGHVRTQGRVLGIVSRGGAFLAEWMTRRGAENPLYAQYDRLLEIARRHDLVLSLGDALRPGCLADATDRAQVQELVTLGELARRAREAGVQAMIEGPGHVPMDQIQANVLLEKRLCDGAPFYVLGPLVTDCAPGYDHITSAIGGALAAWAGADFLCYVTPAEHLGLPGLEDVRQGVVAAKIAAHAADLARGSAAAHARDREMARCRAALDWQGQQQHALDPETIATRRRSGELPTGDVCTMCGPYCSIKGMRAVLGLDKKGPGAGRNKRG